MAGRKTEVLVDMEAVLIVSGCLAHTTIMRAEIRRLSYTSPSDSMTRSQSAGTRIASVLLLTRRSHFVTMADDFACGEMREVFTI